MAKKVDQVKQQLEKRAAKAAYIHRKEQVMEREKDNDRLIILFRSNENWWKMAGKSVLYYTKLVAPRLKKKVKIWPDRDFNSPSREGVVQVRDLKKFIDEVETLGYRVKTGEGSDYMAVELGYKVSDEELSAMVKEEEHKWEMAERLIQPSVVWPNLKSLLLDLMKLSWELCRKMDTPARASFGDRLVNTTMDMIQMLNMAAHGRIDPTEALVQMVDDLDVIDGLLMAATHIRLFTAQKNYDMATLVMKIEKQIDAEVRKVEKAKRAAEAKEKPKEEPKKASKEAAKGTKGSKR